MKKVLLGTTNKSKIKRFKELLKNYDIEFYTLNDLQIKEEPNETGITPLENANIKANFYSKYFDIVLCNDSGLYFDGLDLNDQRQPGLKIRSPYGKRLDDEEMISYYSTLINSLGGHVLAYYLDGIAVVNNGKLYSFMENTEIAKESSFYMVSTPSLKRHPGWPLDSISINKKTNKYFVEEENENSNDGDEEEIMVGVYKERLIKFFKNALNLE